MINLKSRDGELKKQGDNNLIIQEHRRPNNDIIMHTNQTLTNKYSVNYIITHMLPMLEINDYGKELFLKLHICTNPYKLPTTWINLIPIHHLCLVKYLLQTWKAECGTLALTRKHELLKAAMS